MYIYITVSVSVRFYLINSPNMSESKATTVLEKKSIYPVYQSLKAWNYETRNLLSTPKTIVVFFFFFCVFTTKISDVTVNVRLNIWWFPKIVVPRNGWFIMENISINGWFRGSPIFGNPHIQGTMGLMPSEPNLTRGEKIGLGFVAKTQQTKLVVVFRGKMGFPEMGLPLNHPL